MAVKSFPAGVSVTAQTVFNAIVNEVCGPCINNVFSIMADTTSLNSGKKSGVNKRIVNLFNENVGHDIYVWSACFMLTKFIIRMLYQLSKKTQKVQEQCKTVRCLTALKTSTNPTLTTFLLVKNIPVPITNIASLQLKAKVE